MLTSKRLVVLAGAIAMGFSLAASAEDNAQLFDPSRGVIFTGPEAQSVAQACGGTLKSASWALKFEDIDGLERALAPLLAADLRNSGSTSVVRQYYRQYAAGRLGSRRAIFVNGFHETHVESAADEANWRRRAIEVLDGGDSYWCAIYIKDTGEFVKFKSHHLDTHVWFHGLA